MTGSRHAGWFELATPRCHLAACDADAAAAVHAIVTDPAIAGMVLPLGLSPAQVMPSEWIQDARRWDRERIACIAARDRTTQEVVGLIRFDGPEISFAIHADHRKRGLATEIVGIASAHAAHRLALSTIVARVRRDNVASRRVLERCCFRFAGVATTPRACPGRPEAVLAYALTI